MICALYLPWTKRPCFTISEALKMKSKGNHLCAVYRYLPRKIRKKKWQKYTQTNNFSWWFRDKYSRKTLNILWKSNKSAYFFFVYSILNNKLQPEFLFLWWLKLSFFLFPKPHDYLAFCCMPIICIIFRIIDDLDSSKISKIILYSAYWDKMLGFFSLESSFVNFFLF